MLHVFHLDVAKVDRDVAHVAIAIRICCKCMFQMFQLFREACCKCVYQMFQLFHLNIAYVSYGCCICCSDYTCMLQVCVPNVSPVSDVCCMAIHICCKRMFAMFHLVSDACCSKCCSPRALTRGHVRAAHTQPMLPIFVMPAPRVGYVCNGRSMSKWPSTPWSKRMHSPKAGQHQMDIKPSAPALPGIAPMVQHVAGSTRARAVLPPSLSHAAGRPHTHARLYGRSNNTRGPNSNNWHGQRSKRAGTIAACLGRNKLAGVVASGRTSGC
jgi:hypothetical protein